MSQHGQGHPYEDLDDTLNRVQFLGVGRAGYEKNPAASRKLKDLSSLNKRWERVTADLGHYSLTPLLRLNSFN